MDRQGETAGERRTEDEWWHDLYEEGVPDTGPQRAGDTLDDRFASVARAVDEEPDPDPPDPADLELTPGPAPDRDPAADPGPDPGRGPAGPRRASPAEPYDQMQDPDYPPPSPPPPPSAAAEAPSVAGVPGFTERAEAAPPAAGRDWADDVFAGLREDRRADPRRAERAEPRSPDTPADARPAPEREPEPYEPPPADGALPGTRDAVAPAAAEAAPPGPGEAVESESGSGAEGAVAGTGLPGSWEAGEPAPADGALPDPPEAVEPGQAEVASAGPGGYVERAPADTVLPGPREAVEPAPPEGVPPGRREPEEPAASPPTPPAPAPAPMPPAPAPGPSGHSVPPAPAETTGPGPDETAQPAPRAPAAPAMPAATETPEPGPGYRVPPAPAQSVPPARPGTPASQRPAPPAPAETPVSGTGPTAPPAPAPAQPAPPASERPAPATPAETPTPGPASAVPPAPVPAQPAAPVSVPPASARPAPPASPGRPAPGAPAPAPDTMRLRQVSVTDTLTDADFGARRGGSFVGGGPPTYEAEPTALPEVAPGALGELVPDTVLDGARYGSFTLRTAATRGDSPRYRGEQRRDALLTARFGGGDDALVFVAVATGARGVPRTDRAADSLVRWLGEAVGRSRARLSEDIRTGRRAALKAGLHRLTGRTYGLMRAQAEEFGVDPAGYTARLRCLLLSTDPDCRTRVFFGTGPGGLFRLRGDEWQDLEPAPPVDAGGPEEAPREAAEAGPIADPRLTVDLGGRPRHPALAGPPPPGFGALVDTPDPGEPAPFAFRASEGKPGDVLLLCSPGFAEPLRGAPGLAAELAERWRGAQEPPGLAAFLADVQLRAKGFADDRSAAALWES